ncbi:hypothetical protein F8S13_14950 [Chloroflexia bacterium SDU3-3]|nr:hypothetical protein F8S13_14950 [Chloroflexia bacterium SDU3-3]
MTGCTQISIAEEERLRSTTTAVLITPTPSEVPTPTVAPTVGPTATPTLTPEPTKLPLPPTPAPDAALKGFSLCDQVAGDPAGGRFSARVTTITTTVEAKFERLELGLSVPDSSVLPHALAHCLSAADDAQQIGLPQGNEGYALLISLDGWLHDDLFRASTITPTLALSGTTAIASAGYRVADGDAGAQLALLLKQPLPFRVSLAQNPLRLVVEVAKQPAISDTSDMLTQASAGSAAQPAPIYYLESGDIWRFADGKATNLTSSAEVETALAVSESAKQIAFCRVESGASADDSLATSALWVMGLDGGDPEQLAAPGRTCADPAFSPDGKRVAFAATDSATTPLRWGVFTVPVAGGEPTRLGSPSDEWSRFAPQWLDADRLVYAAQAEDTRSTLFLGAKGAEQDIGAALTVGSTYASLGRPLASPTGAIAVEALRADGTGAALLTLDASGTKLSEIASGYWVRPAAWGADGSLYYLTSECASSLAQSYALFQQPAQGQPTQLAYGTTLGGFGQFVAKGGSLAYVAYSHAPAAARGPLAVADQGGSSLWLIDTTRGTRAKLVDASGPVAALAQ